MIVSLIGAILFILIFSGAEYWYIHGVDFLIPYEKRKLMPLNRCRFLFPHDKNFPGQILPLTFCLQLATIVLCAGSLATVISIAVVLGKEPLMWAAFSLLVLHIVFLCVLQALQMKFEKKEYGIPEPDQEELDKIETPPYLGRKELDPQERTDE